jgi:hypothetical protein
MIRVALALLLALPAACGFAAHDGAAGALEQGIDDHRYELAAAEVWTAAESILRQDDATLESRRRDGDDGAIVARLPNGNHATVTIAAIEPHATRVAVAVSPPSAALAGKIQGRIGERLSLRKAQAELFGEISVKTAYPRSLDACAAAAERTCRSLDLEIVGQFTREPLARVEARDRGSRPIRFSLRRIGERGEETVVTITAEAAWGSDGESLESLRREFERHLFPGRE